MPVPIPGPEVRSDSLKVKFLMIFGRPKTGFFDKISGAPGYIPQFPLATNHAAPRVWPQPKFRVGDGDSEAPVD